MQIIVKPSWFAFTLLIIYVNLSQQQPSTKALPGTSETWEQIIKGNKVYVDKTKYLREMLESWPTRAFWLLTRPRRFGKSVFVRMAKNFLQGNDELFKGLDIYNDGNTKFFNACCGKIYDSAWTQFPVLHLDFNEINEFNTFEELKLRYKSLLEAAVKSYGSDPTTLTYCGMSDVITELYLHSNRSPVMVLIDEYDKQFHTAKYVLKNDTLAKRIALFMTDILSEVKGSYGSGKVGFVFVTGVTKAVLQITESGAANDFEDVTYDSLFNDAFGFTENEIRSYMRDHLTEFAREKTYLPEDDESPEDQIMKDLKDMYDGYRFHIRNNSATKIFNPVSVIESLTNKDLQKYWCATSSNEYVIERLYEESRDCYLHDDIHGYVFEVVERDALNARNSIEVSTKLPIYMLTYGYLTVKNYSAERNAIDLTFPNTEMKDYIRMELEEYRPPRHKVYKH
ncbi:uncharacterized protein in vnfD 5'region-like isoform X2 [Planococcus citri]